MLNLSKRNINYLLASFLFLGFVVWILSVNEELNREGIVRYIGIFLFLFFAVESLIYAIGSLKRTKTDE